MYIDWYLVDCHEAVKCLFTTEDLHVRGSIISPLTNDVIQLIVYVDLWVILFSTTFLASFMEVVGYVPLDLGLDPRLPLFVDRVGVIVIVIDRKVSAVP